MADYEIKYKADVSGALAGIRQLTAALTALEAVADKVKPKLAGIVAGVSSGLGGASRSATNLTANINGLGAAATTATPLLQGMAGAGAAVGAANRTAGRHTTGMTTAFLAAQVGAKIMNEVMDAAAALSKALQDARDYARETAEANIKLKDSLRELQALGGKDKDVNQVAGDVVDLMLKTGATQKEATDFATMFESTVPAARLQRNEQGEKTWQLDDKQEADFKVKALALATAKGVSPPVFAEVMAGLGIHQPVKNVDQAMGQADMMLTMGNNAVGKISDVFKATKKLSPTMTKAGGGGAAKSDAELTGLLAAASTVDSSPIAAARAMDQVWRESNKEAGSKAGITPQDDYNARLDKLHKVVETGKAAGKAPLQSLWDAGFHAPAANQAILRHVGSRGTFREWSEMAARGGDPRQAEADVAAFREQQPDRFAANQEFAADVIRGREQERLVSARKSARAGLKVAGEMDTGWSNARQAAKDLFGLGPKLFGGVPARDRETDTEIRRKLMEADPTLAEKYPDLPMAANGAGIDPERLADILNQVPADTLKKIGIDPRVQGGVEAMRKPARVGGGAPAGAGAAAGGAAGPQASNGGAALQDAARAMLAAAGAHMAAAREQVNPFASLPDMGGGFGPMRA